MKGIMDISCASQAATSIRRFTTMDEGSSSSSSITTIRLGGSGSSSGRAIDRYNPIIRDSSRIGKLDRNPTPDQPISPKPTHESHHKISRKKKIFSTSKENNPNHHPKKIISINKSSSSSSTADATKQVINEEKRKSIIKRSSWSCTNPGEFFSPPGSSRYLLTSTDHQKSVNLPDFDPLLQLPPPPPPLLLPSKPKPHHQSSSAAALPPTTSSRQVVVVLRVSLHCRGCERKMRKHLSRMEGVTSFDIDFIAKKLTVVGDVTPLAVLASVSKVKNAQLLTLPPSSSTPSAPSQINKDLAIVV